MQQEISVFWVEPGASKIEFWASYFHESFSFQEKSWYIYLKPSFHHLKNNSKKKICTRL